MYIMAEVLRCEAFITHLEDKNGHQVRDNHQPRLQGPQEGLFASAALTTVVGCSCAKANPVDARRRLPTHHDESKVLQLGPRVDLRAVQREDAVQQDGAKHKQQLGRRGRGRAPALLHCIRHRVLGLRAQPEAPLATCHPPHKLWTVNCRLACDSLNVAHRLGDRVGLLGAHAAVQRLREGLGCQEGRRAGRQQRRRQPRLLNEQHTREILSACSRPVIDPPLCAFDSSDEGSCEE